MAKWFAGVCALGLLLLLGADSSASREEELARHRNLGKAFYENPTTQKEAVEELRKALELAPGSVREQLNYGLALLRAGKTGEGIAELEKVQKHDPSLPHTWFNLGIQYKHQGDQQRAIRQFERMITLAPDDAISHYNLGALYKLAGRQPDAIRHFEIAARLDRNLAAPHFQLFNAYRAANRPADAKRELDIFQALKKQQEGAVIPEDVEWNAYAEIYDPTAAAPPAAAPATLRLTPRKLPGSAAGMAAVDRLARGRPELLIWSSAGVRLGSGVPLIALKDVTGVFPGDFNNDAFPDLCVLTDTSAALYTNVRGRFRKHAAQLPAGRYSKAVWLDYDHDYDLDLLLLGPKPVLMRNQGAAGFADRTGDFPFVQGNALDAAAFRVVANTKGMDLVVSYGERDAVLYRDLLAGKYAAEPMAVKAGATGLTPADIDNDNWIDLVFASGGQIQVLHNRNGSLKEVEAIGPGGAGFALADLDNRGVLDLVLSGSVRRNLGERKFTEPASIAALAPCRTIIPADAGGDARVDLACLTASEPQVLSNQTASKNQWIRVKLVGVKNLKLGYGSEVEVKAGSRYQKKIYQGLPLLFGLGAEKQVDTVRITWPNGLIQNEIRQVPLRLAAYREAQRLSGSCPMIWSWNGREFEYITDVLGVAPLGASAGDGQYFPVDHDEYVQIPGRSLAPVNGHYEIRITEELSEVAYLDQVRLFAVDHPAEVDVFTNDKFKGPPFPEFKLFDIRERIYPAAARDDAGRDVRARLLGRDRTYPDAFPRDASGVAKLHALELDFGRAARSNEAVLVLSGWVDWADGSTFLGAAQERNGGLVSPYLQVRDARGRWRTVIDDMGIPAGKPKTIVVDLAGKFLSASRAVRIVTNLCVYWDEIFLAEGAGRPRLAMTTVPAASAALRFRGFSPVRVHPGRKQPEIFTYAGARPYSMWNPTPGLYTRYGDVRELTRDIDDKFVIMGSGDELRLRFDAARLPPLARGWARDFLLLVDGWAKDRDANTAHSQTTEPLPFHAMSRFPHGPDEAYPDDPEHRRYRETYNTRPALRLIRPLHAPFGVARAGRP